MIFAAFVASRTLIVTRKNRDKKGRKRNKEGGRGDRRSWGQKEGEREFVLYFVFKEAYLFWREEMRLTNIQTIKN